MPDEERESRILDAANELITHYGYDKTTVDDIARLAGVSKGAVYLHFKSKEALFEALLLRESERVMEDMFARIEADPVGGTLFYLYTHALRASVANPLIRALTTQDRRVLGDYARRFVSETTRQEGMLFGYEFVRRFQEAGLIRKDLTAETITHLLIYIRYGFLTVENVLPPEHTPPIDEIVAGMAEMLSRGLAPQEQGASEAGKAILREYMELLRAAVNQRRQRIGKGGTEKHEQSSDNPN
jgi:AcrR family transcriptional regulator